MENLIFELKNFLYETCLLCVEYFKGVHWTTLAGTLLLLYVFFFRKWSVKKTMSFLFVTLLFFVLLVRMESFLLRTIGAESAFFPIGVARTLFVIVTAVVLLYHGVVKE